MHVEVVFSDSFLTAINKPHGLMVHKTKIASDTNEFALQVLRDQLQIHVYPCHRLDRKTSGVLLFAKDEATNRKMQIKFSKGEVQKKYLAIVRGFTNDEDIIDYPLKREDGLIQLAITKYKTIQLTELDIPFAGQKTSRYSLVEIEPQTGRTHQIRKHFAHIFHPIIGDRPYGCNKQNKLFKEKWDMTIMMLHASTLSFNHPVSNEKVIISAKPSSEFIRALKFLGFHKISGMEN